MKPRRFCAVFLALVTCGSMLTSLPSMEAEAAASIESALTWAVNVANDDSHWYSQSNRNGPNYDCSSLVFYALKHAGYDVGNSAFTTRNMRGILTNIGFEWIPWSQIGDKSNLQRGDILLDEGAHTEFYLGDSKCVAAANSDQGIIIENYWNGYGGVYWDGVLRYKTEYDYTDRWPEKPIISVDVGYSDRETVIRWQACQDIADPYYCDIINVATGENCYWHGTELTYPITEETCVYSKLAAGNYYVEVTACNHFYLTTTKSDRVYFTVSDPPPKEYKVDFVVDGEVIESRTVLDGASVGDMPTAPKKDGFAFREWTEDDGKQSDEVHSNLRYTAVYDPRIIGDVSLDFSVDAADAKLLVKHLTCKAALSEEQLKLADFNRDGKVNAVDLTDLKNSLLYTAWTTEAPPEGAKGVITRKEYRTIGKQTIKSDKLLEAPYVLEKTETELSDYGTEQISDVPLESTRLREVTPYQDYIDVIVGWRMVYFLHQRAQSPYPREYTPETIGNNYTDSNARESYGEHSSAMYGIEKIASDAELSAAIHVAPGMFSSVCSYSGYNGSDKETAYIFPGDQYMWFKTDEAVKEQREVTKYKYRERTEKTVYTYSIMGEFSEWTSIEPAVSEDDAVQTRTVYKWLI